MGNHSLKLSRSLRTVHEKREQKKKRKLLTKPYKKRKNSKKYEQIKKQWRPTYI